MEWKRVRNWLILLVLAVDLFLAGNLANRKTVQSGKLGLHRL